MTKQQFKSVYFCDYPSDDSKGKALTLAFNEAELSYYTILKQMSNEEIRELIGTNSYKQLLSYAKQEERSINQIAKRLIKKNLDRSKFQKKDITFEGSKLIPFQRWYPYIEGYSPDFVKSLITHYNLENSDCIYDPFAGTGTTLFSADTFGIKTVYTEINPLLQFLINTKVRILQAPAQVRSNLSVNIRKLAKNFCSEYRQFGKDYELEQSYSVLFNSSKYFENHVFEAVLYLRSYIDRIRLNDELLADAITIAVLSSLIPISLLKKAGDVRFKTERELKQEVVNIDEFLPNKLLEMSKDIDNMDYSLSHTPFFILSNSKNIDLVQSLNIDCVITSPPYLNGTNYFRNTKLELWFLRYIQYNKDLRFLRDQALTSGINDVSRRTDVSTSDLFKHSPVFKRTHDQLLIKAYDQRIPRMAESYFSEMHSVFSGLRKHLFNRSKIVIDIGDSIFANIHIPTDRILIDLLKVINYHQIDQKLLRKRRSRNKTVLSQTLLVFEYNEPGKVKSAPLEVPVIHNKNWHRFKDTLPHQSPPYSKRNWGHKLHSLCSYQGKLKPSIAHHLVKSFVPSGGSVLDPFSGVGTIPFEAALNGMISFGLDISLPAYFISYSKVTRHNHSKCMKYIKRIQNFIESNRCTRKELSEVRRFGFNRKIHEYYETKTLKEIILARRFVIENPPVNPDEMLVISSLLHILHGNRPYALSRRSHPIVPYAPQGDYQYKNLIEHLHNKVERALNEDLPESFTPGKVYHQDTTSVWPQEITNLDAIITSPPFYDSTRFYLANWIRLWFAGWTNDDFKLQTKSYIEEKQKIDFSIYENVFRQSRERLKSGGSLVLHLGKSTKCNMAEELQKISSKWFRTIDVFDESVVHCESHGIRDKGTVTSHQYMVLQ